MSAGSTRVLLTAALAGTALLAGCGTNNDTITAVTPVAGSRLLVVNGSPDAGRLNLTLDGTSVGGSVVFPGTSPYLNVAGSSAHLVATVANSDPLVTAFDTVVPVPASSSLSVFVSDSLSRLSFVTLTDDLSPVPAGMARVRFLNLAAGQPAMDLRDIGGDVIVTALGFRQVTPWTLVSAGRADLEADSTTTGGTYASQSGMKFEAGGVYTLYLCGKVKTGQPNLPTLVLIEHR